MGRVTARRRASHVTADDAVTRPETLVVEEPLEIRVNGKPITVTMRTPGSDVELAQGFLLTEGVVGHRDDVLTVRYCKGTGPDNVNTYNVLDATLSPDVAMPQVDITRNFYTTSSCGVCGKASLDAVRTISRYSPGDDASTVKADTLSAMPEQLRTEQKVFASTGGLHGAALFDMDGGLLAVREDIGRHNAVDKVIGWALEQDRIPLTRNRAAGQRPRVVRTHPEGGDGRHPGARRGVGAVVARRRSGEPVRGDPGGVPAGRVDERLHPAGPHQALGPQPHPARLPAISTRSPQNLQAHAPRDRRRSVRRKSTIEGNTDDGGDLGRGAVAHWALGPLLNVTRGLVDRGDRVTVLTTANRHDMVRAVGATPVTLPREGDLDLGRLEVDDLGRAETSGDQAAQLRHRPALRRADAAPGEGAHRTDWRSNISTPSSPTTASSGVMPFLLGDRAARPPVLLYSTTPLMLSSRDTAPAGLGLPPSTSAIGRLRNRTLNQLSQKVLLRQSQKAANYQLDRLNSRALPTFLLDSGVLADRLIVPTVPEFDYPRTDLPANVRYVGAVHPAPTQKYLAPAWWRELDGDRPVVHVTQGTVDNTDLGRLLEPTIEALADEDVIVVASTGGRHVSELSFASAVQYLCRRTHSA